MHELLYARTKDNDSRRIPIRIETSIGEIKVQSHQDAIFPRADIKNSFILGTLQTLASGRSCVVPASRQHLCESFGQILIQFEAHVQVSEADGMRTICSRASSAAYATAACISSSAREGYSRIISCAVCPSARLSSTTDTMMRVPRIQAFPWQTCGSAEILSRQFIAAVILAQIFEYGARAMNLPMPARPTNLLFSISVLPRQSTVLAAPLVRMPSNML